MAMMKQKDMSDTETSSDAKSMEVRTGWIQSTIEKLTQTYVGQFMLKNLDNVLWIVEKSAEWSLPQDEPYVGEDEDGKPTEKLEVVRPLPWIFFLPSLVILRSIRMGLNIGAFLFGFSPVKPISVIRFAQKSRKHLRILKNPDRSPCRPRSKRKIQGRRLPMNEAKRSLIRSIRLTLSTLSCLDGSKPSLSPPPTRIHISALDLDATPTPEEKSTTESAGSPKQSVKHNRTMISSDGSNISAEETLQEKIDRLVKEGSTDDSDFIPSISSIPTSNDDDDENEDMLRNELQAITEDAKSLFDTETEFAIEQRRDFKQQQDPKQQEESREQEKNFEQQRDSKRETLETDSDKAECDLSSCNTEREFQTPTGFSQDGDALFFSPISSSTSNSTSVDSTPERPMSPYVDVRRSFEKTNNGAVTEKRSTNVNKYHHRGKRTSYGNRKKK